MTGSTQGMLMVGGATSPMWTQRTAASSKRWRAAAYGGGVFVAAGLDPAGPRPCAMYSLDYGVTWTNSPTTFPIGGGSGFTFYNVAYGAGKFIGGIDFVTMYSSSDGINWTAVGSPPFVDYTGIFFSPTDGIFTVISASTNTCTVSGDGVTWGPQTLPSSNTWSCGAALGAVRIIAANQVTAKSVNGITWASGGNLPWSDGTRTVAAGNGVFVATRISSSNKVAYSADNGVTWSFSSTILGSTPLYMKVLFSDGYFLLFDQGGQFLANSTDGITWALTPSVLPIAMNSFVIDAAADNARHYIAVGELGSITSVVASGLLA